MGSVLSSAAAVYSVLRATKNYARRWFIAQEASGPDWSELPEDLLLIVMAALDIPSLHNCDGVCSSWRNACNTFRLLALKQAPCLLYACEKNGSNDATLYCPTTDSTFLVPFPGPPHEKRGFVFSCHGWVFAADEVGNPYIFNPITGVQGALPPVKTIMCRKRNFYNDDGEHVCEPNEDGVRHVLRARHSEYVRVAISSAAEVAACTVLIVHQPDLRLSFARPGDKRWTLLPDDIRLVSDVLYNDKDGLFYILHSRGSIRTLDLSGPSPSMATIMDHVTSRWIAHPYLALAPSGELLQVWRMEDQIVVPLKNRLTRQDVRRFTLHNFIEFTNEDGCDKLNLERNDYEEDELGEMDNQASTTEVLVFKVDTDKKKLVEMRDIGGHTLFLGFNATVCLLTKGFSLLEPNCVYLTDDYCSHGPVPRNDLRVWNMKKRSMQKLGDAWPNVRAWLDIPAPIWIAPRF